MFKLKLLKLFYLHENTHNFHLPSSIFHTCCFNLLFNWTGNGWFENLTQWKSYKRVRARGRGARAFLVHALQCLCDGRACCPALIFVLEVSPPSPVVSTCCSTGLVRVGLKFPQDGDRANAYVYVAMVHSHVWRTLCSVCVTDARVAQPLPMQLVIDNSTTDKSTAWEHGFSTIVHEIFTDN